MKSAYSTLAERAVPSMPSTPHRQPSASAASRRTTPHTCSLGSWQRLNLRELAVQKIRRQQKRWLAANQQPKPPPAAGAAHSLHTSPDSPAHHLTKRPWHSSQDLTAPQQRLAKAQINHSPPTSPLTSSFKPSTFGHWYMQCKGYARLGRMTSPALIFGKSIASLGIANSFTIHLIRNELHWHNLPKQAHQLSPRRTFALLISILAIFPLVSAYSFLMVAQPLRRLQLRSGMKRPCSNWLVLWSSIIPPCGLFYLSLQLNRYWRHCVLAYATRTTAQQQPKLGQVRQQAA